MAVFRVERNTGLYGYEQPPLTQQGAILKGKRAVIANAVLARGLGLYPCGAVLYQPGEISTLSGNAVRELERAGYITSAFKGTRRERTLARRRLCDF